MLITYYNIQFYTAVSLIGKILIMKQNSCNRIKLTNKRR